MKSRFNLVEKIFFDINSKMYRIKNPKINFEKMDSESERLAAKIFIKMVLDKSSELLWDFEPEECFIINENKQIYLFLENKNLKIINTVIGYDILVSEKTRLFMMNLFKRQLSLKRMKFKNDAMRKVEHSLESTYEKISKE